MLLRGLGVGPSRAIGRVRILDEPEAGQGVARRRGAGGAHDVTRLGADDAASGGDRHRCRWHAPATPRSSAASSASPAWSVRRTATTDPARRSARDGRRRLAVRSFDGAVEHAAAADRRRRRPAAPSPPSSSHWRPSCTSTSPSRSGPLEVAQLPVDGVGLLRGEFLVTQALGGDAPARVDRRRAGARSSSTG